MAADVPFFIIWTKNPVSDEMGLRFYNVHNEDSVAVTYWKYVDEIMQNCTSTWS
jgi:hypothetical protein